MSQSGDAPGSGTVAPDAQATAPARQPGQTLMVLRLGKRWFAVDVMAIEEVALKGQVTRVPKAPSHILGVTTLRGRLITVVGLEQMIGGAGILPLENSATLPRLLVVREGGYEMALVAEEIHGMIEHGAAAQQARPKDAEDHEFVREVFDWQGNRVALLDAHHLVATAARLAGIASPWQDKGP
jgi:purine-binding chemotaxis protein CheW